MPSWLYLQLHNFNRTQKYTDEIRLSNEIQENRTKNNIFQSQRKADYSLILATRTIVLIN